LKDHISVSQINLYMACSLKYKFAYIDEKPKPFIPAGLALGLAVHSAVEWFNERRFEGKRVALHRILRLFEADWYAVNCETVLFKKGETKRGLLEMGKNLLSVYFNNINGAPVAAVEYPFEVPLVDNDTGEMLDLPLKGRFDLVEQGPVVVDLKTAARKMAVADVDMNLQLTAYSYAYWYKNGRLPDLRLDVLIKTSTPRLERMPTTRKQHDHRRFFAIASKVISGIKHNVFFPNPSWMCAGCEYRQICWMYNGNPE